MRTFKDQKDREWKIKVDVWAVDVVFSALGVDLLSTDESDFNKLISNLRIVSSVIYHICKEQADSLEVSEEDFKRSLSADSIHSARMVFIQEMIDFCPDPKRRQQRQKTVEAIMQVEERLAAAVLERLESPDLIPNLEQAIKEAAGQSGELSGSSQESQE